MISLPTWRFLRKVAQSKLSKAITFVLVIPPIIPFLSLIPGNHFFSGVVFKLESYVIGFIVFSIAVILTWVFTPEEILASDSPEEYGNKIFILKPQEESVSIFNQLQREGLFQGADYATLSPEVIGSEYYRHLDKKLGLLRGLCVCFYALAAFVVMITYLGSIKALFYSWLPKFITVLS